LRVAAIVGVSLGLLVFRPASAFSESPTAGVELGVAASRFSPNNTGESITIGHGTIAGFYAVVPIRPSISLVAELVYYQKYSTRSTGAAAEVEYVGIPLLAKMPFLWHTYFIEGVAFNYPVNVRGFAQDLSRTTSPDVGVVIGGGYDINKLAIEFRYDGGLRRISTVETAPIQRSRSFALIFKVHL
jgi:hypothetical protein